MSLVTQKEREHINKNNENIENLRLSSLSPGYEDQSPKPSDLRHIVLNQNNYNLIHKKLKGVRNNASVSNRK